MKLVLIFVLFSTASLGLTETSESPPAEFVYACSGETVSFPWRSDNKTKKRTSVKWYHHLSNDIQEMVAVHTNNRFLAVEQRVSRLADHKLTLRDATVNDSGLYTVEIKYTDKTRFYFTFYLQVSDSPMVKDGELEVTQDPDALWNETSKQWAIKLFCGTFTFKGNDAPIQVDWILPNGKTQPNNGFEKGRFYYIMSEPVRTDMNYTCRVPPRFYPNICLIENKIKDSKLTEASFLVEGVKTRLTLAEAEEKRLDKVVSNLSSILGAKGQQLSTSDGSLEKTIDNLKSLVIAETAKLNNSINSVKSDLSAESAKERQDKAELENITNSVKSDLAAKGQQLSTSDERLEKSIENLTSLVIAKSEKQRQDKAELENSIKNNLNVMRIELLQMQQSLVQQIQAVMNDVCVINNYKTINDAERSSKDLCEMNMTTGWYRWLLHGQDAIIPTSCTPTEKVCTDAMVWIELKGQPLPSVGRDVQAWACVRSNSSSVCCGVKPPSVTVRNCGSYYIYHFNASLSFCDINNCLQTKI